MLARMWGKGKQLFIADNSTNLYRHYVNHVTVEIYAKSFNFLHGVLVNTTKIANTKHRRITMEYQWYLSE